ncbi:3'-5' exonuclease [Roseicitreum antarcticum]|uniref:DNA-directed DNA polymerase n=1 Tax=Roseicitreum antarcticum TaxID=564137 RepID=A0A1H3BMN3_9RHOB|nr:3'-5' exonuclease [Roseicitreum antarcticum]SDX43137.1 DNA polymerase-3 subunit epsilon [Roseicitreum antarcticum]
MAKPAGLRARLMALFGALALGCMLALAGALWLVQGRMGGDASGFVQAGLLAGFGIVGLIVAAWFWCDTHLARAADALAGSLRARTHAGVNTPMNTARARYLGDLGGAAAGMAQALHDTRGALADAVARETDRLSSEKLRLEKLLADVPVAVLLCTADHQLVFYNGQAVDLLDGGAAPGLDRNVLDYLREGPVRHAYQRLIDAVDPDPSADLLCATTGATRLLAGRMRVLRRTDAGVAPGYVLTLRDVTADMAVHTSRETLLADVFDRVRRPAANLQTVIGVLAEAPELTGAAAEEMRDAAPQGGGATQAGAGAATLRETAIQHSPPQTADLTRAMIAEIRTLTAALTELGARYDEGRTDWRPLNQTRSADLMDSLRARFDALGLRVETDSPDLIVNCDGFELVTLLGWLGARLAAEGYGDAFQLRLREEDGPGAMLDLTWTGKPLPVGTFDAWLTEPMAPTAPDLTGRGVLLTHGTEGWTEARGDVAAICMPVRNVRRAGRRPAPIRRAVVYDFDLLSKARSAAVADSPLGDLTYVVFDTETTGLNPGSDEIVQIAAVRVVNGRRVEGEVFDTLVDPARPIPASSTEVHGITDAMVVGAPGVRQVTADFHRFAKGAVLIAHNAPFDMAFLRRHEDAAGVRFDNPVLDTVLLSAVLFGQLEEHSLDALTMRLGITIPEEARHTALGDTVATADAFLKLMPMLRARGLGTFGEVLAEVRRHGRLLRDLNDDVVLKG